MTATPRTTPARSHTLATGAICALLGAAWMLGGCSWLGWGRQDTGSIPVTFTFENIRTFRAEDERDDERVSEWDLISPRLRRRHVKDNAYGIAYQENPRSSGEQSEGLALTDYQVRMVVENARALARLQRDLASLEGERVGRARLDLAPTSATLAYASSYVVADLRFTLFGRAEPGAKVIIYDHTGEPRETTANQSGSWRLPVRIDPDRDYIYGRSTHPGTAGGKHFRIHVFSQEQEELSEREFERGRP